MKRIKTTEYFNKTDKELLKVANEYGYTKEDNLILDDGIRVLFYDNMEEDSEKEKELKNWISKNKLEIKAILETVNNRIAYVLI